MTRTRAIPHTITVHVPFRLVKRGGRKEIVLPTAATAQRKKDDTLVKALARAFRWKRLVESGKFATFAELARHERIATSYLSCILRLTLLAPDVVEAILDGKHGPETCLPRLMASIPSAWDEQLRLKDDNRSTANPVDGIVAFGLECQKTGPT